MKSFFIPAGSPEEAIPAREPGPGVFMGAHKRRRVLVTGGAGSVGLEVLKELYRNRNWYQVKVVDRPTAAARRKLEPFREDFRILSGDLRDPELLEEAAREVDFVIHLAAVIPPLADREPALAESVNVEGTRRLIRMLEKHSPDAFFLYTSSISVYGDRVANPWITAGDPLLPSEGDEYARTKIRAERIVRESALKWSIFRLSAIMGPETKLDPLFFHMPLDTSLEIATARDTGFALVESIYHPEELNGKTFNLSGGPKCRTSYRDFLANAFRIMGLKDINLPEGAFAKKNFHCGIYADADKLQEILHFQEDGLSEYFDTLRTKTNPIARWMTGAFRGLIRLYLLRRSEPLKALRRKDTAMVARFF